MVRSVLGEFGVLIVEPDAAERARLRRIFDRAPGFRVAGEARNGTEAIQLAAQAQPHLVHLRLDLTDLAGYAVTSLISARLPGAAILIAARDGDDAGMRLALRMGAVGCIAVGSSDEAIVDAARQALGTVLTGRRALPEAAPAQPTDAGEATAVAPQER